VVHTPEALLGAILALVGGLPRHVVLPRTSDPWATAERHRDVAATVEDGLRSKRLQARTVARFGPTWLLQGLENLDAIASVPSVDALRGAFAGRPCVIASPGPSLSRNVGEIPALRDRVLLMAGTHCLGALGRAGLVPDVVMAADPGDLSRHCEGTDLRRVDALVVGATCRRENFFRPAPRILSFASNGHIDDWIYEGLGEDAGLSTGGSVACSELSLALLLGCDPILFVGQDLSFPEGRYYAEGSIDGNAEVVPGAEEGSFFLRKPRGAEGPGDPLDDGGLRFTRDQKLVSVPGWHGGTVPTSESFQAFLTWFEAVVRSLGGSPRVLNCTEGGARIRGMEHVPLAEAGLPAEAFACGEILDRALAGVAMEDRRRRLAERLREMIAALDPCLDLARRSAALAGRAERDRGALEELGRREKEFAAALRPVRLFSLVAQDEIVQAQEQGRLAKDLAASLAASRALFRVVERAVLTLRDPLQRALGELA